MCVGPCVYYTLCIIKMSPFLPRDAMQARPMPSCSVCRSVCLSVTFIHSVKTSNRIFKPFYVFPYQASWQYYDGDVPLTGAGRHKSRFWMNIWLLIDDCCTVRSTLDGRRCTSVSQLWCTSVYGTETATHQ